MVKVFLGGTCNNSEWRSRLIALLEIDYFNPVVDDWTEGCMKEEVRERETCDFCLYVITPLMTGVYSIAEAVDDSNKRSDRTLFAFLKEDDYTYFSDGQIRSLNATAKMIKENGAIVFDDIASIASWLNERR